MRLGFIVRKGEASKNIRIMDAVSGKCTIKRHDSGTFEFIYTMGNFIYAERLPIAWLMDLGGSIEHTLAHATGSVLEGMVENMIENILKK